MSEWINHNENPPEEDVQVLVAVLNEAENHGTGEFERFPSVAKGTIYKGGEIFYADTDEGEFEDLEILGWKPLPEPPKAENRATIQSAGGGK